MEKPILIVMAAGMGSRYGGLKQIDPIDEEGHIIMDYSIFDACRAGFEKVIFVIKKENETLFRERIGDRVSKSMEVAYAFQTLDNIPEGYKMPEGRVKPWGTAHAVLSCEAEVNGPFAVINADDYYGSNAFSLIYDYLSGHEDDDKYRCAMVGYRLKNTVTENGSVARGVCLLGADGTLAGITERTRIEKRENGIAYSEDDGNSWVALAPDTVVSMNLWGFSGGVMKEIAKRFPAFLNEALTADPLKGEYYLPAVANSLVAENKATVQVLISPDKWYGVTYREDKPDVVAAMRRLREEGHYPVRGW